MNYVIDENENLVSIDIQEIAFNAAHPVGEIYIQFPGKSDPQTLYGRGSWDNISNEFAGLFFRAEGGNAGAFQSVVNEDNPLISQDDKIRNILAKLNYTSTYNYKEGGVNIYSFTGAVDEISEFDFPVSSYSGECSGGYYTFNANANTNSSYTNNPMAGHADGPEIRPVNTTIRIWQRIA